MQDKKYIFKLILIIFYISNLALAKDSKITLLFNINANLNLYNADFKELQGFPICCTKFTNGNGIAPSFNFGFEYKLSSKFIGNENKYGLTIGYNDLSAKLKTNEFIANKIYSDRVERIYADFTIDSKISSIQIQNYFITDISGIDNLKLKIFLDAGFLIGANFSQKEEATSPNDFVFETNKRTRSEASGAIPNLSSLYLALGLGLSYPIFEISNFKIYSDFNYNYSFTNFISSEKWNSSQIKLGLTAKYNLQKENKEPITPELPKNLPLPIVPEPPKSDSISIELTLENNGKIINNQDTIIIERNITEYIENYGFLPVVFYETNSLNFINTDLSGHTNEEQNAQKDMKNQIVSYLLQNPELQLNIISHSHSGEKNGIDEERAKVFIDDLVKLNINKSRLTYKTHSIKKIDNKREELTLDNQKLEFEFSNGNKLLQFDYSNKIEENFSDFDLNTMTNANCSASPCVSIHQIMSNGKQLVEQLEDFKNINFKKYNLDPKSQLNMQFIVLANDSKGNSKNTSKFINFKVIDRNYNKIVNLVENKQNKETYEQYILAFTEFDKSKLIGFNNEVAIKIKSALLKNKKVELLALTDNLGTEEYNKSLAQARAKSALSALGLKESKINIISPNDYIFSNKHPYGRLLNRAIIIRIFPNNN